MVREEISNYRDLRYSNWHRTLPDFCYCIDFDFVEWRSGRGIVAIIEVAVRDTNQSLANQLDRKQFEAKILYEAARKLNVNAYIVFYNESLSAFWIFIPYEDGRTSLLKVIGEQEYEEFIKNL